MAAKKAATKKTKKEESISPDKHWFPEDAKPATAATSPAKRSPWQRRPMIVNYGTLAKPGINFKDIFNQHIETKHKKLSDTQRDAVWKVVINRMLSEPLNRLTEITDETIKAQSSSK